MSKPVQHDKCALNLLICLFSACYLKQRVIVFQHGGSEVGGENVVLIRAAIIV